MTLSDTDIALELDLGNLRIDPYDPRLLQPASVDVRLGGEFAVWSSYGALDPREPQRMDQHQVADGEVFELWPGGFALAHTVETVTVPADMCARYEGKSSIARLGLASHITGAFIDPGFSGQITLELANLSGRTILLRPGMAIGQLAFSYLSSPAHSPYGAARGSHYAGQTGATPSAVTAQLAEAGLA